MFLVVTSLFLLSAYDTLTVSISLAVCVAAVAVMILRLVINITFLTIVVDSFYGHRRRYSGRY